MHIPPYMFMFVFPRGYRVAFVVTTLYCENER